MIAAMLTNVSIRDEDDEHVVLGFKSKFNADQIANNKIRPVLEEAILQVCGKKLRADCEVDSNVKIVKPSEPDEELFSAAKDLFEAE